MMRSAARANRRRVLRLMLVVLPAQPVFAQSTAPSRTNDVLWNWVSLDAPPGDEYRATQAIIDADSRWQRDDLGNIHLRLGSGRPRRLVACGIDSPGFVVSQITDDGYLRLHRTGNRLPHPLFDQFHEGQQAKVLGRSGIVRGVVAIANGHFARQHRGDTTVVGVDQLWLDVGASTRAGVERSGIALLDPVRRDVIPWEYAGALGSPDASARIGCAAVASAAAGAPFSGETVFLISAQRTFNWSGLTGAVARLGSFDELVIAGPATDDIDSTAVVRRVVTRGPGMPAIAGMDSLTWLSVRARFSGSLVESVNLADADSLLRIVHDAAGMRGSPTWMRLGQPAESVRRSNDSLSAIADLLRSLADLPGVPGNEWRVRDAIRAALPPWARSSASQDSAGNLILAMGPDRDTAVFIAHMDEVGYVVRSIGPAGIVSLTSHGGVIPSAWEGQPALVDLALPTGAANRSQTLRGVFVPRDTASVKRPRVVQAWFGLDSARLVAAGVRPGQGVTAYKRGTRIGTTRFTARSLDDRAGSTALILATRAMDPARLDHKVLFVWSVREEGGLHGARALARRIGASVKRIYAIDTFVSSDTPLESPHFAHAPLGGGPVLRGMDDGVSAPRVERERVQSIARAEGIPMQIGTTHGSTDATAFAAFGAPGMGLSWPGRYSHSPAEVLDLRDLAQLVRVINAVAAAPAR